MSAIAGIINKDGRPADPVLIEKLMASLDFRGPDGRGTWISANVALGFQAFWTTPEDTGLNRPLADPVSGLVIVMDGRVDNRSELLPLLSLRAALVSIEEPVRDSSKEEMCAPRNAAAGRYRHSHDGRQRVDHPRHEPSEQGSGGRGRLISVLLIQ